MDGAAATSQLTAGDERIVSSAIRFELATAAHDVPLRRLLRENPMPGAIAVSLEREPSFFAAEGLQGPEHQTIVAIEADRVVAAGSISARTRFINGQPMRVGYLGGLRLDKSCRGRSSILRHGYEAFRKLHEHGGPRIYLTSITADNLPARRFLEKGLAGMPTYRYLGEFATLIIGCHPFAWFYNSISPERRTLREKGFQFIPGSEERRAEILKLLNQEQRACQFAPVWSWNEIHPEDFRVACSREGAPVACGALWDQRSIKQAVVRGYSRSLRWARPFVNFVARFLRSPGLPRIGTPLSSGFISHLAARPDQPELLVHLVSLLRESAHASGIRHLMLGLDSRDPRLARLRKAFHPREYVSRIYVVHWKDGAALAQSLDDRLLAPEVALL